MDVTPELLDQARTEADRHPGSLRLSTIQRRLRVPYTVAVALAERLQDEGHIGPQWRAREMEEALRSHSLAALAHENVTAGRPIEDGWSTLSDIHDALASWRRCATRLGATTQDFDRARDRFLAERRAALAEYENEARVRDALRQDILAQVADLYGVGLGGEPMPGAQTAPQPARSDDRSERHADPDEPPW